MSTFEITEGLAAIRDHFSPEYNVSYSGRNGKLEIKRTDYHWVDVSHTLDVNTNLYHIEPVGCAANDYSTHLCEDEQGSIGGHVPYTSIIAHITQCLTYGVTCQGPYTTEVALQLMAKGYVMGFDYDYEASIDTRWQVGHSVVFDAQREHLEGSNTYSRMHFFKRHLSQVAKGFQWYIARTPEKRFD